MAVKLDKALSAHRLKKDDDECCSGSQSFINYHFEAMKIRHVKQPMVTLISVKRIMPSYALDATHLCRIRSIPSLLPYRELGVELELKLLPQ